MLAVMGMYARPENQDLFDDIWGFLHARLEAAGIDAPPGLGDAGEDCIAAARKGELLLGQVCGITYALTRQQDAPLSNLGCFIDDDPELASGFYTSYLICRGDTPQPNLTTLSQLQVAANGKDSFSGWYQLCQYLGADLSGAMFKAVELTGAHRNSAWAVAEGLADLAAIDSITFGILQQAEPDLTARLQVMASTRPAPGLPFVTSASLPESVKDTLRQGLEDYAASAAGAARLAAWGIHGYTRRSDPEYDAMVP